jgi:hypothetical protein
MAMNEPDDKGETTVEDWSWLEKGDGAQSEDLEDLLFLKFS